MPNCCLNIQCTTSPATYDAVPSLGSLDIFLRDVETEAVLFKLGKDMLDLIQR